ncbi:hypothetical protein E2C01_064738 [Portunus trituberculatus]|uniref:Uncharacterized protein n=1 Tax=Portunus trituberculatus TaxID=210409 RepID=A0A5B7HP70_PORTR|nr:hypothetical protein [Portunus trituberculatus]
MDYGYWQLLPYPISGLRVTPFGVMRSNCHTLLFARGILTLQYLRVCVARSTISFMEICLHIRNTTEGGSGVSPQEPHYISGCTSASREDYS